ncbi:MULTISPECIES: transcriptional regulator [Dietzia]|uniref:transcriptional regulator n=1 Tax=Dietzia TaxID=37914 RepID=UPI000D09310F|nr:MULTISPECIES: transcriptional regulator [Dietzia]AVM63263.1 MarR family transcriptional regulator [Dietzia sp. oral taxon 368]MCT1712379.1 transcriptional regulator [Dietzia cinnamea]MCT2264797.1 transcriptional regulator [Dietzia cinnamea]MCT2275093.1 transcriptional regulator [Dietzia cinnamea]
MRAGRPAPRFDEIIHAPHRLRICALLSPVESMEFGTVRDELGVADSVLSKQFKVLVDAGYATTSKAAGATGRARTWLALTRAGRNAFGGHLEALRDLAAAAEGEPLAPSGSVAGAGVEGLDRDRGDHHRQADDPQQ